jgi:chemotaxis protein histidine kinase CheA
MNMNQPAELVLRAPDISRRFLSRTKTEVERSRELFTLYLASPKSNLSGIQNLMHKIRGSGALFGFDVLSSCAMSVEKLAAGPASADLAVQLEAALHALEVQVDSEVRARAAA